MHNLVTAAGYYADYSPIQIKKSLSGDDSAKNDEPMQKNLDVSDYERVYNVFGHAAASCGYTFGKVRNSEKTFYINTDYSSTLFKDGLDCETYNANFLMLVLKARLSNLALYGKIALKNEYKLSTTTTTPFVLHELPFNGDSYYIHDLNPNLNLELNAGGGLSFEMDENVNIFYQEQYYNKTPISTTDDLWGNKKWYFNGVTKKINNKGSDISPFSYYVYSSEFSKAGYCIAFIPAPETAALTWKSEGGRKSKRRNKKSQRKVKSKMRRQTRKLKRVTRRRRHHRRRI